MSATAGPEDVYRQKKAHVTNVTVKFKTHFQLSMEKY